MTIGSVFRLLIMTMGTAAFLIGIWLGVDRVVAPPPFIFPRLSSVLSVFADPDVQMMYNIMMTAAAAGSGLLIAMIGSTLAVATTVFLPALRTGILGISLALKATPIVAMAPLLVIWLGTGLDSKIACAALPCFFPILASALSSIEDTPSRWVDVAKVFGASNWEIFATVRLPNALPWILTGVRIAAPLSIVGAIVGELVGARAGLGYVIIRSSYQLETNAVFAAILSSAAMAGIFIAIVFGFEVILDQKGGEPS